MIFNKLNNALTTCRCIINRREISNGLYAAKTLDMQLNEVYSLFLPLDFFCTHEQLNTWRNKIFNLDQFSPIIFLIDSDLMPKFLVSRTLSSSSPTLIPKSIHRTQNPIKIHGHRVNFLSCSSSKEANVIQSIGL